MGKSGGGKTGTSIRFTYDTLRRLDEFCKQHFNAERSAVVCEAVKKFLDEKEAKK